MSSSAEEDSDSSDFSNDGGADEAKMRAMLADWDNKDPSENNDVFVDSDSDNEDDDILAESNSRKKMLALRNTNQNEANADDDDDDEEDDDDDDEEIVHVDDDDDDDDVEDDEEDNVRQTAPVPQPKVVEPEEEDEDTEEYEEEVIEDDDDDEVEEEQDDDDEAEDEDESEDAEPQEEDEDDDDDEPEEEDDDDDDDDKVVSAPPSNPTGNAPTPSSNSKKVEDDDDEREVIDDGNIEDTLKKKPKKKKEKKKIASITAASADDTEEDAAMKALLSEWGGDDNEEDLANDDDDDDDDDSEVSEREVSLEDNVIDHIVLAAPDLEEAMAQFEKMTGIAAKVAGSINGLGIKCARISFNDSSYIEIIAPDPKQAGPIGQHIKAQGIKELTPFHFAVRSSRAEELKNEVKQFGYVPDHITMFGGQKDGTPKKWEMLFLYGHKMGGVCPFFINWANSDHPCVTLPVVGKLKKFTIRAPEDDPVHKLFDHVDVNGFNIEVGKPKMSFQFSSPEGTIKFATSKAVGFKFPGFDDEENDLDGVVSDDDDLVFDNPNSPELLEVGDTDYDDLPPPAY